MNQNYRIIISVLKKFKFRHNDAKVVIQKGNSRVTAAQRQK